MQYVTLVNRSSKTLNGTWDGRSYKIAPGKHEFPEAQAMKFRDQNPVMGTEDPYSLNKQYLLAIPSQGDDVSPIEQTDSVSLQDLTAKIKSGELRVVRGNGLFQPAVDKVGGLPNELAFTKP